MKETTFGEHSIFAHNSHAEHGVRHFDRDLSDTARKRLLHEAEHGREARFTDRAGREYTIEHHRDKRFIIEHDKMSSASTPPEEEEE